MTPPPLPVSSVTASRLLLGGASVVLLSGLIYAALQLGQRSSASPSAAARHRAAHIPPKDLVTRATVSALYVHPVKGMQGMKVASAVVGPTGFLFDREWAVMVGGDTIVSCNRFPLINSATATMVYGSSPEPQTSCPSSAGANLHQHTADGDGHGHGACRPLLYLQITAPTVNAGAPLFVPVGDDNGAVSAHQLSSVVEIDVFGMKGYVRDEGDLAADWLQKLLPLANAPRLVRVVRNRYAKDSPSHQGTNTAEDQIKLHDYAAYHLICEGGIAWLQSVMPKGCGAGGADITLTAEQFRANIVLDGAIPFPQEDYWDTVVFIPSPTRGGDRGDAESEGTGDANAAPSAGVVMRVAKQSGRCVIPTTQNGHRPRSFEPTATLRRLRRCYHRHQLDRSEKEPCFMFGLDLFASQEDVGSIIAVGDTFEVRSTREAPVYF